MNRRFLDALNCQNKEGPPPVWLMRQAGRYMPEYRAIRKKHSFLSMCHEPELIAEVTELPIRAFDMDAAILFSDILVIPEAFDVGLRFDDGIGPIIERPVRSKEEIPKCINITEKLSYVKEGIELLKPRLSVPLIGFAGAPFTVASYMIEGKTSKSLSLTKEWMFKDPAGFHALLNTITEATISYLQMQEKAGVDAIQIFDSWANALAPKQFEEYSLFYMNKIKESLSLPTILFCRGSSLTAGKIAALKPAGISIDWNGSISDIRREIGPSIALQGNLDPDVLMAPPDILKEEIRSLLDSMKGDPGYIFNLGHGILPHTNPDAVKVLVETIRERLPCKSHVLSL